ncbi:MAG TPA: inositol monophosphatase family protein [Gemmatimonadaceae bacterium]|nr:inositol monophosphatase family protein [Gemmatimonadaceae bacterium]
MTDVAIYMDAVRDVARVAGDIAKRYYGRDPETRTKSDGSPVSIADVDAERTAREWIERRFPEDGIIGEELPSVRADASRRWVLDPIDGTYTFLQSVPLWGTLVAVVEGSEVIAGAAYFPALDEIIVAALGEGCWWNGSRAAVSTVAELGQARLLTSDARFLRDSARRERWTQLQDSVRTMRTWGDCYGYLLVATGRAEIMVDDVMSDWDSAALLPIITEAGGVFTDWQRRATPFGGDVIATNANLAAIAREILTPAGAVAQAEAEHSVAAIS